MSPRDSLRRSIGGAAAGGNCPYRRIHDTTSSAECPLRCADARPHVSAERRARIGRSGAQWSRCQTRDKTTMARPALGRSPATVGENRETSSSPGPMSR